MKTKNLKNYTLVLLLVLGFCILPTMVVSYDHGYCRWCKPKVPSEDQIFGWAEDIYQIGIDGKYGYRMPGTDAELKGASYIYQKFKEFGLKDTHMEPVPADLCEPEQWKLKMHLEDEDEDIPCYFLRYANFTDSEGIKAEMVYVGTGSDDEFHVTNETAGIEGKIVLVDIIGAPWPRAFLKPFILFEWDPDDTFADDPMATENWPLDNLDESYSLANTYGAVGYVGILTCMADHVNQYLHWYGDGSLPGLTVSPNEGNHLKELLEAGPKEATIILTGESSSGFTHNVYGTLPGETDDIIVILTHHDGWATNEASGTSIVMALAKYFSRIPKHHREKTLLFYCFGSHFGKKASWNEYNCHVYNSLPKVACAINIEMIGKQIKIEGGEFFETGLVAPRGMFLSGPFLSANEYLLSYASEAIVKNDMERTSCLPGAFAVPGEGGKFHAIGIPTINFISHNAPQFTQYDTLDTIAKEELVPTTNMFIDIIKNLDKTSPSLLKWTKLHDGRDVKLYPDLQEYVWEMKRPPYGPYDKIGLRRVVKAGIEPKGVVFILPGTWSNGEQLISNPPEDKWTMDEKHSHAYYLANRGFDVYAIDYRTHFVNLYLEPEDLAFMAEWGWDTWISDIKEAVELAKIISGVKRIYLAGESFGGSAAMNYASMYWQEDLKGIILRDGGTGTKYPELVTNTFDLPAMIAGMIATGNWYLEVGSSPGSIFALKYADENPGAPPEFPPGNPVSPAINPLTGLPWANISEWAAFMIYMAWGEGVVSNITGGYGDPSVMIHIDATFDRYWPSRLGLESSAISNWDNCPYVTYDFDDHYSEIDVPLLAFTSELFGLAYWGPFRHGITNPDFTGIYLWNYGHLDVYAGEYSELQVSKPTYDWLMSRRMLLGTGKLYINNMKIYGEIAIYINENVIDFKINDVRVSWEIVYYKISKGRECYKGENELGWFKLTITKNGLSIGIGRKVFFFGWMV